MVVGTHLDEIPRAQRDNKCKIWRDKLEKYRIGRHHSKAYPRIKDVHFVGCPPKGKPIHVEALNDLLYDVAMDMDAPRGKCNVIRQWLAETVSGVKQLVLVWLAETVSGVKQLVVVWLAETVSGVKQLVVVPQVILSSLSICGAQFGR